jgi:plasmid stabilization system protein ParE
LKHPTYRIQPAASRDIRSHVDRLLAEAGPETAVNFVDSARASFERLATAPGIGSPIQSSDPTFAGLRKWPIDGFPRVRFFYVARRHGVDIVRVLHAASDWHAMFDAD